jgi:hypothetical protein
MVFLVDSGRGVRQTWPVAVVAAIVTVTAVLGILKTLESR